MKKKGKYSADESDLEDEWIESHEEELKLKAIEAAKKKHEKVCLRFLRSRSETSSQASLVSMSEMKPHLFAPEYFYLFPL